MSKANSKTAKGFEMLKKMVEPEVEDAEIVGEETNSVAVDAAQEEADKEHERGVQYNLLINRLLSVCGEFGESGTPPDIMIGALISAAGNVGNQTFRDTDQLRNFMGHCYAQTWAALEAHRGLGQGEEIQSGNDTGSEGKETH